MSENSLLNSLVDDKSIIKLSDSLNKPFSYIIFLSRLIASQNMDPGCFARYGYNLYTALFLY